MDDRDTKTALPADDSRSSSSDSELTDADKALAALGYAPVFKREFSTWSAFSFALSISGVYATIMTTFSFPLYAGGSASAVWCWLIAGASALCLAFSIAELASAYPTSGAMYFTLKYLCPEKYVPVIAWIDGWLNLIGQIAGTASSEYGAAQMLLAAVSIGSGFEYFPTQGHIIGVMAALTIFHAVINSAPTAWLNHLAKTYAVFHIGVLVAACIALLVTTKDKHSAEYVFTNVEPLSGWTPPGFSFLFGFLSVQWTLTDYDACAHCAEECKNPAVVVPRAIATALSFTYVAGWLFNIVLCFCMGEPADILASPIAQPVVQIFYNNMGAAGAIFFAVAGFMVMNFVCITAMHAGARTVWAYSRDEMLPGSRLWYKVWSVSGTPVIAVWMYAILCVLINLVGLGSYITIAAIFNICAIALDWSYCIPILCKLFFHKFERGPWHLGKASPYINAWACLWTAFVSVIFLFPTVLPVAADNMNYAVVILAFVLLVALAYWYIAGQFYYTGPRTRATIVDGHVIEQEPVKLDDPEQAPTHHTIPELSGLRHRNPTELDGEGKAEVKASAPPTELP